MSGKTAQRGFIFQTIIAMIECLERNDWDEVKLEPGTEKDKVDIQLYHNGSILSAIQVKSCQNEFKRDKVKEVMEEIYKDAENAEEIQLILVGDKFSTSCKSYIGQEPSINTVSFENLNAICTESLKNYILRKDIGDDISVSDMETLDHQIFAILHKNSIKDNKISRDEFEKTFKRMVVRNKKESGSPESVKNAEILRKRRIGIMFVVIVFIFALAVGMRIFFVSKYFTNKTAEKDDPSISLGEESDDKEASTEDVTYQHQLSKIEPGTYYVFGAYEQDNDRSNGKEDIAWLVLAKEDNRILLISRFALDCQPYNEDNAEVTWETCDLRTWLNDTFLKEAFSEKEQDMIMEVTVNADANPSYDADTDPGNNTTDKIFLLSLKEAGELFSSFNARECRPTPYAIAKGAMTINDSGWWWLRSPGYDNRNAGIINHNGRVFALGAYVVDDSVSVRPVIWLNL